MYDLMSANEASTAQPRPGPLPTAGGTPCPIAADPACHVAGAATLLAGALDEVDIGVALLDVDAQALHVNHRARQILRDDHALQLRGLRLCARDPRDLARLHDALRETALRGLRRLLALGDAGARQLVALVPVQPGVAALLLGRAQVCEDLSVQCFARTHQLTAAETRVLAALGRGVPPSGIAREQGVKLSTVRTQIAALRDKTGAASITDLVRMVAALPPMVGALRN